MYWVSLLKSAVNAENKSRLKGECRNEAARVGWWGGGGTLEMFCIHAVQRGRSQDGICTSKVKLKLSKTFLIETRRCGWVVRASSGSCEQGVQYATGQMLNQ